MAEEVDDFLAHYGVLGMKWGRRTGGNSSSGVPRRTEREAAKDAKEYTQAKMFYGEGAGTRRKLIKAKIQQKSKDPAYKEAFDRQVSDTNMAKRADQARGQRKRTDTSNKVKKTARGVNHVIRGNSQYATTAAVLLAGAGALAYKNGGDKILKDVGNKTMDFVKNEANIHAARKTLRDMGL